jgi:arsenite/tail-anchored protein-transporting ATPase
MDALSAFKLPVRGLVVSRIPPDEAEGAFLARRKQVERRCLEQIAAALPEVPRVHRSLLAEEVEGLPALDRVATHLARQL